MSEQNLDIPISLALLAVIIIGSIVAWLVIMRKETVKRRATYRTPSRHLSTALRNLEKAQEIEERAKRHRIEAEVLVEEAVVINNHYTQKNEVFV